MPEEPLHVPPAHLRSPPRLNPAPPTEPRWQDLPASQQQELLRRLGRMLADRLAAPDPPAEGTRILRVPEIAMH